MLKNYLKLACRTLLKGKTYTFLANADRDLSDQHRIQWHEVRGKFSRHARNAKSRHTRHKKHGQDWRHRRALFAVSSSSNS
jgi:hypothetical protein